MNEHTAAGDERLDNLRSRLASLQPGLLAVSGGVDSRFLACLAHRWGLEFTAVFFDTPVTGREERNAALEFLNRLGLPYRILQTDPLSHPDVAANTRQRCYACKRHLFAGALELARSVGAEHVVEGSHADDASGFRPGRIGLCELGIRSPLVETGFDKATIRRSMRRLGLPRPEQPSSPCLLTRFAYGYSPSADELRFVDEVEAGLRAAGLARFRMRILSGGRRCLQIEEGERAVWRDRQETFRTVLEHAGLRECAVRFDSSVSGFFDRGPAQTQQDAKGHGQHA